MEGDLVVCGITLHAEEMLNNIVFIELPQIGSKIQQSEEVGILESIKSVSNISTPLSGEVVDLNPEVQKDPSILNKDPLGKGWLFKIKASNLDEVKSLMDADLYDKFMREGGRSGKPS